MLKKLGLTLYRHWRLRKLPRSLRSALVSTAMTTGDLECAIAAFKEPSSAIFSLTCGGKITTVKADSFTLRMRGVASCSCLNIPSQAVALTIDGMKYSKCPMLHELKKLLDNYNEKEKENA